MSPCDILQDTKSIKNWPTLLYVMLAYNLALKFVGTTTHSSLRMNLKLHQITGHWQMFILLKPNKGLNIAPKPSRFARQRMRNTIVITNMCGY